MSATAPRTPAEKHERKDQVLTHKKASSTRGIADAIVLKEGNLFLLTRPNGLIPMKPGHGLGLYLDDCRFLNGYEVRLGGSLPESLVAHSSQGHTGIFQIGNEEIQIDGGRTLSKLEVGAAWLRQVDGGAHTVLERITFHNYGAAEVKLPVDFAFRAEFEDIFEVRGLLSVERGTLREPRWDHDALVFEYDGTDGVYRTATIRLDPAPAERSERGARFALDLGPGEESVIELTITLAESRQEKAALRPARRPRDRDTLHEDLQREAAGWMAGWPVVRTDSMLLQRAVERSFSDLRVLQSRLKERHYIAAGLPWFGTLFGRDSEITSLQILAFRSDLAEQTCRLLADYQGSTDDPWKDEQPGKILHELRTGELARSGQIPHTPYYGTVDATPLFVLLIGRHSDWTGSTDLFRSLRPHVDAALQWIADREKNGVSGWVSYHSTSAKGLVNQGWKDSGDGIVNADGSLGRPPIALVEVQAYAYEARRAAASLLRRIGDGEAASRLEADAEDSRRRFERDFWMENEGMYSLGLQEGGEPLAVPASNAAHALWCGIASPERARSTADRLFREDMYTGWGIRTLSDRARRYNPVGYHLGTVWPHDNSIAAAGMRRYGMADRAGTLFSGMVEASLHFSHRRLPELFAGFRKKDYEVPVRYPVACHPQAWAAGAIPSLLESSLGLDPRAFERKLRVVDPVLPRFVQWLTIEGLRVGDARVDLAFRRRDDGHVEGEVRKVDGKLDVEIVAGTL